MNAHRIALHLCLDIIEDSVVPVVKVTSEYVPMRRSFIHRPTAKTETTDTKDTAPDAHVIGKFVGLVSFKAEFVK